MSKATQIMMAAVILAAFAVAQDAPAAPEAPQAPATPAAPQTPATAETPATPRAPRAPRPPKPPRPPREARRSYLGIDSRDVTPERAGALHLSKAQGVEVMMVDQDAPAGKAGLKEHDVIVGFNGKSIGDPNDLRQFIRDTEPGSTVTLGIMRDGKPMDVKVKIEAHPSFAYNISIPPIHIPPMPDFDMPMPIMATRRNGMTVEPITRQLADVFGVKDGHGVMVRAVDKNSPAELAGFRAGDIIVRVGSETIDSVNDWNQSLRQQQTGKINVTVIREKREQNFTLALPERRSDSSALDLSGMQEDLGDMQIEIADIGPEVQRAMAEAQREMQKTFNNPEWRKQFEQSQREAQREIRHAMEMNRAEMERETAQARREAEKARKEWEKERKEWQKDSREDEE
jgi:membrane-associated protease RseP (regulator of RpoE activity)